MSKVSKAIAKRPTETATGAAFFLLVYQLLNGTMSDALAAIIALIIAFAPAFVSEIVDAIEGR